MRSMRIRIAGAIAAGIVMLAASGCGHKLQNVLRPEAPPTVQLRITRLSSASADSAAFVVSWTGSANGGRVDHYLRALDPGSADASDPAWIATRDTGQVFRFAIPSTPRVARGRLEPLAHRFAIRAVSGTGRMSPIVWGELSTLNVPPVVQIVNPTPSALFYAHVPENPHIDWAGYDPDGVNTTHPVRYKYKLFADGNPEFDIDLARSNPDSLRRFYAPGFADWDSVGGDMTSVSYAGLAPDTRYLFAIVAFDQAGDYSPVFNLNSNMLSLFVCRPWECGPQITIYDQYFNAHFASGYNVDPNQALTPQVPANLPLTFQWSAESQQGAGPAITRWSMDIADPLDETPRIDENTDVQHWSAWSANVLSATLAPFQPPATRRSSHLFYVEARDGNGSVSLAVIRFQPIPSTFSDENSLLIVDDTRLFPDQRLDPPRLANPDSIGPPVGPWPTAAELDTFLFARGGVRWRMTPDGTLSPPGIFAGFHYDTISTQFLSGGMVPLSLLSMYRHVVWMTEMNSASGNNSVLGTGALRLMSDIGRANTLAAYVGQGGQLWLLGGAAGFASTKAWNSPINDGAGGVVFSSSRNELSPGRFMFDFPHWQVGFTDVFGQYTILKSAHAIGGWPGSPDYSLLPAQVGAKSPASDPVPPLRAAATFFNSTRTSPLEYISEPTQIPDPSTFPLVSTLDTLYEATGPGLPGTPAANACMTYYHGSDCGGVVFTGFNLWSFTRPDLVQLTDFVLERMWGLARDPVGPAAMAPEPADRPFRR